MLKVANFSTPSGFVGIATRSEFDIWIAQATRIDAAGKPRKPYTNPLIARRILVFLLLFSWPVQC